MKATILAAVLTSLSAPLALAQPSDWRDEDYGDLDVHHVAVLTGDLNFADPRDRDEAVWRIHRATAYACRPDPDRRNFDEARDFDGCRTDAFDDAVSELEERVGSLRHRRGHVYTREYPEGEEP